jgi:2-polyprenyl-3-methyl-5-hydroxy-6-metoxy-1,4-benzoquinol methylase
MADPAVELDYPACPLCGSETTQSLFIARDRLFGRPGEFPVVRCLNCGLVFLKPRPSSQALAAYYPDTYYPLDAKPSPEAEAVARDLLRKVNDWVRSHGITQPRLLDVGCGTGLFLHLAAEAGMQVRGIELSASAVNYARTNYGLDVQHGTLEDAEVAPASCDIVVMWHVLEHLPDPVAGLRQVADILAPGGLLFAAVPNFGSYEARLFGRRWYSLDAPRHLVHVTPHTLRAAAEQAELQVQEITHSSGTAGLVYSLMGDLAGVSLKLRHRPLSDPAYHRTAAALHTLTTPLCRLAARRHHGGALELQATKPTISV